MKEKMEKINIGIVGVGGGGRAQIDYFKSIKGVQIKGLFDVKPMIIEDAIKQKNLKDVFVTTDYNDFLKQKDINAVSICSPDQTHCEYSTKALYAGKNVLCEKPMVTSLDE